MSNDLISRSALIEDMRSRKYIDKALCEIFETVVDDAPTAYDLDAVCEELKKLKNAEVDMSDEEPELADAENIYEGGRAQGRVEAYVKAVEIVRNGGKK